MVHRIVGNKRYELTNHLGNVLAVISDHKIQVDDDNDSYTDYYLPDVFTATDYYPFGSQMIGRTYSSVNYRYGFDGQEKDNEIYGEGNAYTTFYRALDVRLARWFASDPNTAATSWERPYVSMGDNPVLRNDPIGDYNRVMAWAKNKWNKGKGIEYSETTGEWNYEISIKGVTISLDGLTPEERIERINKFKSNHVYIDNIGWIKINTFYFTEKVKNNKIHKTDDNRGKTNAEHLFSRSVKWISQYDPIIPGAGGAACYNTCFYMARSTGVNPIPGMANGFHVAKEEGTSLIPLSDTRNGYKYMDGQLAIGNPVIVGVARHVPKYWGNNLNGDGTTDHFVLVVAKILGSYQFYDPGPYPDRKDAGVSPTNLFKMNSNSTFTGASFGLPMTISWIGKNK